MAGLFTVEHLSICLCFLLSQRVNSFGAHLEKVSEVKVPQGYCLTLLGFVWFLNVPVILSRDSGDKTPLITAFLNSPSQGRPTEEQTLVMLSAVRGAPRQCWGIREGCQKKAVCDLGPARGVAVSPPGRVGVPG